VHTWDKALESGAPEFPPGKGLARAETGPCNRRLLTGWSLVLVVEVAADLPVQLVDVHGTDALTEALVLGPKPPDRLLVIPPLVGVAGCRASRTQANTSSSKRSRPSNSVN
jgi:hypothetical protein